MFQPGWAIDKTNTSKPNSSFFLQDQLFSHSLFWLKNPLLTSHSWWIQAMLLGSSLSLTSPATTTFKVVDSNNALPVLPWLTSTHLLQQSFSTDLLVSLLSNLSSKCKSDCVTPCRKSIDSLQIQIPSRKHSEFSSRKYKGLPEIFLQLYWHSLFFFANELLKTPSFAFTSSACFKHTPLHSLSSPGEFLFLLRAHCWASSQFFLLKLFFGASLVAQW